MSTSPLIILDKPQMGENIGAAARIMGNFDCTNLRLVAPRDGWPNEKAEAMASHAKPIIDNATIHETTPDALVGCHLVFATTARDRHMDKPVLTPREAAAKIKAAIETGQQAAILFGGERAGLDNDQISLCDGIIAIPVGENYPSLNLAQAVAVCVYEWFVATTDASPTTNKADKDLTPATKDEIHGMLDHLATALDQKGYFRTDGIKPHIVRNLTNLTTRSNLTSQEVNTLRGMIRSLAEGPFGS